MTSMKPSGEYSVKEIMLAVYIFWVASMATPRHMAILQYDEVYSGELCMQAR